KYIDRSYQSAIIQFSDECRAVVETDEKGEKVVSWYRENIIVDYEDLPIDIDVVSTFDSFRYPESVESEIKSSHDDIRSELDLMLYFEVNDLYRYVSMLSKMSRKYLQNGDSEKIQTIFSRHDKAEVFCNQLFFDKKWYEDEEDGTLKFKLNDDGELVKVSQLSSGEKQMLILLLSTLTQNGRGYISFWDEPEISLHIGWQQQLIRVMRELNPNMQLIIATHSPSILHEGWEQRAINVNDIKTKQK
ncbi:MAG: ATP-binding protein, partial [Bacteroidales bacterium]|nr:ATP-binding protein [Bacteroidales bacterium]